MSVQAASPATHHKDHTGARIGMWLFLFTEILLFGGLFLLYSVYRSTFPEDFHYAATHLDTLVGTANTLILLTSSLTVVLAIAALRRNNRKLCTIMLSVTILAGLLFMVNKYFEWHHKFDIGLYPNSKELLRRAPGENLFYGLYFAMTGIHALHVIIGLGVLSVMLWIVAHKPKKTITVGPLQSDRLSLVEDQRGAVWTHEGEGEIAEAVVTLVYKSNEEINDDTWSKLENSGLYWHLVDVIWIFLFPLLYLIT